MFISSALTLAGDSYHQIFSASNYLRNERLWVTTKVHSLWAYFQEISLNNFLQSFTNHYWSLLSFTEHYWVLLSFTEHYWSLLIITEFYWVLLSILSITEFYWVLLSFTEHYWSLLIITEFYWVLLSILSITEFYWALLSFTEHYWVILSITELYWELLSFTASCCLQRCLCGWSMLSLQWSGCQWCLREWSFLAMSLREASLHVACMSARYVCVCWGRGRGGVFRYTSLMLLSLLLLTPLLFLLPPRSLSFSLPTSLSSSSSTFLPSLQAGSLWDTYRQFEQAVLSSIQVRDIAWCWSPLL